MNSFEGHKDTAEDKVVNKEQAEVSRREFIKTGVLAAAGIIFGKGESVVSQSSENIEELKDPKYIEGIDKFRKMASAGDPEHLAFYIIKEDGGTQWFDLGEQNKMMSLIPLNLIKEHEKEKELNIIHTHPTPIFSMPPSTADVSGACEFIQRFGKDKLKIRSKVVDSHGTWEYSVPEDSKFYHFYKEQQSVSKDFFDYLINEENHSSLPDTV